MELILALTVAGPLGYFARTRSRGLVLYLLAWCVVFPIQTAVVLGGTDPSGDDWSYWPINAAILALGIGLNRLGATRAERRAAAVDGRPASG
jgi:hypothetical protein